MRAGPVAEAGSPSSTPAPWPRRHSPARMRWARRGAGSRGPLVATFTVRRASQNRSSSSELGQAAGAWAVSELGEAAGFEAVAQTTRLAAPPGRPAGWLNLEVIGGEEFHPGPGYDASLSSVHEHPKCGREAEEAYAAFLAEQDRLLLEHGKWIDAPYLASEAHADYDRAIHNASARLEAARFSLNQAESHIDRIRAEDFAQYGVKKPSAASLAQAERCRRDVERAEARLSQVRDDAARRRDAEFAALERIRPGVTGRFTKKEAQGDSGPSREERIAAAVRSYEGPRTRVRKWPKLRCLRDHAGMPDITRAEWREACRGIVGGAR